MTAKEPDGIRSLLSWLLQECKEIPHRISGSFMVDAVLIVCASWYTFRYFNAYLDNDLVYALHMDVVFLLVCFSLSSAPFYAAAKSIFRGSFPEKTVAIKAIFSIVFISYAVIQILSSYSEVISVLSYIGTDAIRFRTNYILYILEITLILMMGPTLFRATDKIYNLLITYISKKI